MANRRQKRADGTDSETVGTTPAQLIPVGYVQISDVSAVVLLTAPAGANVAIIQTEGAPVRWRDDGGLPTASLGMRLPVGSELRLDSLLDSVRIIQEASGAKLNISFYG